MSIVSAGQIWREVDPRFERYVRIVGVFRNSGAIVRRGVAIKTVLNETGWPDAPKSRITYADPERFVAKRGGYALVEDLAI